MPRKCSNIAEGAAVRLANTVARAFVRYLEKQRQSDAQFAPTNLSTLRRSLEPGDVLLVDGNSRISGIIKYLTQSNWSHAALYVGRIPGACAPNGDPDVLVEAEVSEGVGFLTSF
jgi:hypothetical protein